MSCFSTLESQCRGFLSSKKLSSKLYVVALWPLLLDVIVLWSWDLDAMVYVPPQPRFDWPTYAILQFMQVILWNFL